tara:strand:- start:1077 stop:1271 length:195 start_codon:yes stop_codon:yes gene_type:complete
MEAEPNKPIKTIQADIYIIRQDIKNLQSNITSIKSLIEQLLFLETVKKTEPTTTDTTISKGWFY